jgi:hypothetical protein
LRVVSSPSVRAVALAIPDTALCNGSVVGSQQNVRRSSIEN